MRNLFSVVLLASMSVSNLLRAAEVLTTPTYKVTVTEHCAEGIVGCGDVSYVGVNTKTGKDITLKGKAVMVMCADGVTPCHLGYYVFVGGKFRYSVFPDGRLVVENGGKVVLSEAGVWQ